jgi:hypothetical protein
MNSYEELLNKIYAGAPDALPKSLLCLDPGETTGWALFENGKLTRWGQAKTVIGTTAPGRKKGPKVMNWSELQDLFEFTEPTAVVCEDYKIYAHKLDRHTFSSVETLRLIGGIDMTCAMKELPLAYQMAVQAKGFVTDAKLKRWGFWIEGMRHSRDAIRHGIYYLFVTNRPKPSQLKKGE